jgi:hypothetical protein
MPSGFRNDFSWLYPYDLVIREVDIVTVETFEIAWIKNFALAADLIRWLQEIPIFLGSRFLNVIIRNLLRRQTVSVASIINTELDEGVFHEVEQEMAQKNHEQRYVAEGPLDPGMYGRIHSGEVKLRRAEELVYVLGLVSDGRDDLGAAAAIAYHNNILVFQNDVIPPPGSMGDWTLESIDSGYSTWIGINQTANARN